MAGGTAVKVFETDQQVRVRVGQTVFAGKITRTVREGVYEITILEKLDDDQTQPLRPMKAIATAAVIYPIERIPEPPPNS